MDEGLELLGRSAGGSGGTSRASSEHGGASSEGCRRRTRKKKEEHHPRSSVGTSFVSGLAKHVDGLIEVSSKTILPCVCACARLHTHTHMPCLSFACHVLSFHLVGRSAAIVLTCENASTEHDISDGDNVSRYKLRRG